MLSRLGKVLNAPEKACDAAIEQVQCAACMHKVSAVSNYHNQYTVRSDLRASCVHGPLDVLVSG